MTGVPLESFWHDVRQACRAVAHSRRFAIWVIGSLALGMAVAIAALAFLNALLLRPYPGVVKQEQLVRVGVRISSPADYGALQEGLTRLQGLAAYSLGDVAVALPEARSMRCVAASANYFGVLGVGTTIGRAFDANDEASHAAVAVIAHSVWTRELGADPSVIGRSIRVADDFVQIVGVASPQYVGIDLRPGTRAGARAPDIFLPLWLADRVLPLTRGEQQRQARDLSLVGRLRDGATLREVQAEAQVVATRLAARRGQDSQVGRTSVRQLTIGNPEHRDLTIMVVLPIPILVLAIACLNAANLMLARGSQRQREIAIRLAIGSGRFRIVRQLLIESAVLTLAAASIAVPLAWWGLWLASTPLNVPIPIDATVLGLAFVTAAVTTIAFGLAPALRVSAQQPSSRLTLGPAAGRADASPRQARLRRALVVAQAVLSLGLLATAGQLVATVRLQAVSGGTPADRLLIARFDLQSVKLPAGEAERFYSELVSRAPRLPGVEAAGLARQTSVWTFGQGAAPGSILVWQPGDGPDEGRMTIGGYAGGDLFQALGLRILQGRAFADADRLVRPQVAVVNQIFAESMTGSALGSVIRVASRDRDLNSSLEVRIVGVVEPTIEPRYAPGERPAPKVYLPSPLEAEPALALYVRTHTMAAVAPALRELVREIAPRVPILEMGSLAELNERSYGPQLWLARAGAFLGVIALLLATSGLYGVSSYVVTMRSREIAIRMALGARPGTILAMILNQSVQVAAIGLVLGAGAALVVSRVIQAGYHGIVGIDGIAFGGAVVLFLGAMLLAGAVPALRASRLDPVENLKDI